MIWNPERDIPSRIPEGVVLVCLPDALRVSWRPALGATGYRVRVYDAQGAPVVLEQLPSAQCHVRIARTELPPAGGTATVAAWGPGWEMEGAHHTLPPLLPPDDWGRVPPQTAVAAIFRAQAEALGLEQATPIYGSPPPPDCGRCGRALGPTEQGYRVREHAQQLQPTIVGECCVDPDRDQPWDVRFPQRRRVFRHS